jgi:hypothetical protein
MGQADMLVSIAQCFDNDNARIKKQRIKKTEESWVLESAEFARCTTGDEVLATADDIVSRINHILALYCNFEATLGVEYIDWIDAQGKPFRTHRDSVSVNIVSSKGQAELKKKSGTQPLGSAIFEARKRDSDVKEALSLHGDGDLSWGQVYDLIEFLGGVEGIARAGYAKSRGQTRAVRQTANHHRHLGNAKNYPLPLTSPTLAQASEFARSLLKRWIAARV